MNRYRAKLIDPGNPGNPLHFSADDREEIDTWAAKVLSQTASAGAVVNVYQKIEEQIAMICKLKEPETRKADA